MDNKVTVLDNFSTGHRENLAHLSNNKNFTLIEGDIRDYNTCLLSVQGIDFVLHEAALGSVPRSIANPMLTNDVNISGFVNMLYAASQAKVERFVYAASSSTYGDSAALPKEEDKIGKPLSPYAITKLVNELYAENFHKIYGIDTIGLRYFNVFGRRQDPNGAYAAVIPKFVQALISHQSPTINGDGSYSRDFTYIDNVIEANLCALTSDNPKALNQVYNVACGENTSILQLFELLKDNLAKFDIGIKDIEPIFGNVRAGDVPHSLASIKKAEELLNYHPLFNISEGLEKTVSWYWNNLKR
jgi:UDP-N-acetylglucosamine 4-epimerase